MALPLPKSMMQKMREEIEKNKANAEAEAILNAENVQKAIDELTKQSIVPGSVVRYKSTRFGASMGSHAQAGGATVAMYMGSVGSGSAVYDDEEIEVEPVPPPPPPKREPCIPCAGSGKRHSIFDDCVSCEPRCVGLGRCGACGGAGEIEAAPPPVEPLALPPGVHLTFFPERTRTNYIPGKDVKIMGNLETSDGYRQRLELHVETVEHLPADFLEKYHRYRNSK